MENKGGRGKIYKHKDKFNTLASDLSLGRRGVALNIAFVDHLKISVRGNEWLASQICIRSQKDTSGLLMLSGHLMYQVVQIPDCALQTIGLQIDEVRTSIVPPACWRLQEQCPPKMDPGPENVMEMLREIYRESNGHQ